MSKVTRRHKVTVQSGSTGFHLFMTALTGGMWALFVWPLCRRTVVVTRRGH
jgi:hypothetical protein